MHFCKQSYWYSPESQILSDASFSTPWQLFHFGFAICFCPWLRLKGKYDSFAGTGLRNECIVANISAK